MTDGLISRDELLERGWTLHQIFAVLDEPEDRLPSRHWYNKIGEPLYSINRVKVAEFRIGLSSERPTDHEWVSCEISKRSNSFPILTFDFQYLAEKITPGSTKIINSLRISHPRYGRIPGTVDTEKELIKIRLIEIANFAFGDQFDDYVVLQKFLSNRNIWAQQMLSKKWHQNVVVRPAHYGNYVSKAYSKTAAAKFINSISLIYGGIVKSQDDTIVDLIDFLTDSPRIRFDKKGAL